MDSLGAKGLNKHFQTSIENNRVSDVQDTSFLWPSVEICMRGEVLMKFGCRNNFKKKFVFVTQDLSRLCWRDEGKNNVKSFCFNLCGCVKRGIDSFLSTKWMRKRMESMENLEKRVFSIYCSAFRDPICIECSTAEQCERWVFVLNLSVNIMHLNTRTSEWFGLKSEWDSDKPKTKSEIRALLRKSNISVTKREISAIFNKLNLNNTNALLSFDDFFQIHLKLSHRKELQSVFEKYASPSQTNASVNLMHVKDFIFFLFREQHELVSPEVASATMETVLKHNKEEMVLNIPPMVFTKRDFVNYLSSNQNYPVDVALYDETMDMSQPLSSYFVATSHNTYLENDQYKGRSSVDMYIQVLRADCRCVEIDCWDGPNDDPIVYHGYTLTQKILFSEVIKTLKNNAFGKTDYPLIISLENHCSQRQQNRMSKILIQNFGDQIATRSDFDPKLASPLALRGKICVKGSMNTAAGSDLQKIIFYRSEKLHKKQLAVTDLSEQQKMNANCDIRSFSEKGLSKIKAVGASKFAPQSNRLLYRCYPALNRVLSSNYNPAAAWSLGIQMAAMNYQTNDKSMILNNGMFALNGGCGYVLKTEFFGGAVKSDETVKIGFDRMATFPFMKDRFVSGGNESMDEGPRQTMRKSKSGDLDGQTGSKRNGVKKLVLTIISASQLPKSESREGRSKVVNPYVQVDVCGLTSFKKRTKTIYGNGFNPVWHEEMTFETKGSALMTSMVMFRVFNESPLKNKTLLASNSFLICMLKCGYRFVPLKNIYHEIINRCGLHCLIRFDE